MGEKEPAIDLSGISVSLSALRLRKAGEKGDFLKMPLLSVNETDLDLTEKVLKIGNFSSRKGELLVKRSERRFESPQPDPPCAGAERGSRRDREPSKKSVEPERPWLISLKQILVDGYNVRVEDQNHPRPGGIDCPEHKGKRREFLDREREAKQKSRSPSSSTGKGAFPFPERWARSPFPETSRWL